MNISTQDVEDLRLCGTVAVGRIWWGQLFYRLKDAILTAYGEPAGYAQQQWDDACWNAHYDELPSGQERFGCDCGEDVPYASHYHILSRWSLDGEIFHRPTEEFSYVVHCQNAWVMVEKQSPRYAEFSVQATERFEGRKSVRYENKHVAWRALLRLARKFSPLLKDPLAFPERQGILSER